MSTASVSTSARSQQPAQPSFGQEGLAAASDNLVQFISFAIGDDQYGVDIMAVREIKEWTEITHLPTVNHRSPLWEPEPLRWMGIRFAQEGFARLDKQAAATGQAPTGTTLVERIGRH